MLLVSLLSTGCAFFKTLPLEIPAFHTQPFPKPKGSSDFLVGVGRADITPPPGYPTGGHGPAGGVSRGYWTRLYARAFYFETDKARLALVSCDLFMVPGALQDLVASRLWKSGIAPGEIVLAATHTHQGAGNYGSASAYNEFGSRHGGFSRELLTFLADQIASAILKAECDARVHPQQKAELVKHVGNLAGGEVLINRSPRSFLLNPERDEIMNTLNPGIPSSKAYCAMQRRLDCDPGIDWDLESCPRLRAVDNRVTAIDVKRDGTRIGLMLFLAFHPTALEHEVGVYSGDVAELVVGSLERSTSLKIPMAAFFNGAEGDVSLRRCARDVLDVRRLANSILDTVCEALASGSTLPLQLEVKYWDSPPGENRDCLSGDCTYQLAKEPVPGVALLGGGEGDRTVLYQLGWSATVSGTAGDGQGLKLPGLDSSIVDFVKFTNILAPAWKWPARLPLSVIHLGGLQLLAIPVEMTTAMAYRIRTQFLNPPNTDALMIGLANEYVSYVTTPEEYMPQEYSAASTLWGPYEGLYIACRLAQLEGTPPADMGARTYYPGDPPADSFGPAFLGDPRFLPTEGIEMVLRDTEGRPALNLPWFQWPEVSPGRCARDIEGSDFKAAEKRHLSIWEWNGTSWEPRQTDNGVCEEDGPDDDTGFDLMTILMRGSEKRDRTYAGMWLRPLRGPIVAGTFRFQATRPDGTTVCSDAFSLPLPASELPRRCVQCDRPTEKCK